ncbi:hypothetical protein A7M79_00275 [Acinetobacter baumannii]|uniref:hypothetical protein n=1 Tax=Acinetobacter baumannii TaxID=470 RepID=UPI0008DEA85A|nr:hypothetical protein [Acinetobacter baumannii]OIH11959.1 hypothetical protein A7M79_00275 [Acinetobacter baumannii]
MSCYQITHSYDALDQKVFIKVPDHINSEEVKSLAVYVQFKAEEMLDETITLSNMTVAQFLYLQGAKILDAEPQSFSEIDMYFARSDKCGGRWNDFSLYDEEYGEQASGFLLGKARGKNLEGSVI